MYDINTSLPIGYARTDDVPEPQVNVMLTDESQNITQGQTLMLDWHNRFTHLNFARIQQVLCHVPFTPNKSDGDTKCEHPKCHICEVAKANRRAKRLTLQTKTTKRDGALNDGDLKVGNRVLVDHFESHLLGSTYASYGKPSSTKYVGGALLMEHISGVVHIEHQVGFSAVKTIRVKQSFELICMDMELWSNITSLPMAPLRQTISWLVYTRHKNCCDFAVPTPTIKTAWQRER
jgi:hypothetical protein